jgi:hypothetical protein
VSSKVSCETNRRDPQGLRVTHARSHTREPKKSDSQKTWEKAGTDVDWKRKVGWEIYGCAVWARKSYESRGAGSAFKRALVSDSESRVQSRVTAIVLVVFGFSYHLLSMTCVLVVCYVRGGAAWQVIRVWYSLDDHGP